MQDGARSLDRLLENIVFWGDRLARFMDGVSKEDFSRDELRQAGASKCIEAIGEASGEILKRHKTFANENPELELAAAYRARNRLSHGYDTIDSDTLWDTAKTHVPYLTANVRALLEKRSAT